MDTVDYKGKRDDTTMTSRYTLSLSLKSSVIISPSNSYHGRDNAI